MSTPRHLWIVGILGLLWNLVGVYDYLMTQTENAAYMAKFSQEQLDYFYSFPMWAVSAWAIAVWGGLVGVILLLMRKKLAAPVLLVSWIAMIISTINTIISGGFAIMGGAGPMAFTALIFVIAGALWFYARAMVHRQVLA
jgi:hypothetical protein